MIFCTGWYLLYTKHNHEKKVAHGLQGKEIEYYLPTARTFKKLQNKQRVVDAPVFPSYIFVFLRKLNDYYTGLTVDGVIYFVRFGKEIAKVKDETVDSLKQLISHGGSLEVSSDSFQKGTTMHIKEGPMSGMSCEVVEYKNEQRILVRVNLLNRCVLADVPVSYLMTSAY